MPIGRAMVGILAKEGLLIPKKLRIAWKFSKAKENTGQILPEEKEKEK